MQWNFCIIAPKWSVFSCHFSLKCILHEVYEIFSLFLSLFTSCLMSSLDVFFLLFSFLNTQHNNVSSRPWDRNRTTNATNKQERTKNFDDKNDEDGNKNTNTNAIHSIQYDNLLRTVVKQRQLYRFTGIL